MSMRTYILSICESMFLCWKDHSIDEFYSVKFDTTKQYWLWGSVRYYQMHQYTRAGYCRRPYELWLPALCIFTSQPPKVTSDGKNKQNSARVDLFMHMLSHKAANTKLRQMQLW
jgi:hypothetical protein